MVACVYAHAVVEESCVEWADVIVARTDRVRVGSGLVLPR